MAVLLDHLKRVASKNEVNKMTSQNLAVCFGPVVLCPSPQAATDMETALDFKKHIEVLHYLLDIWPENRDVSAPLTLDGMAPQVGISSKRSDDGDERALPAGSDNRNNHPPADGETGGSGSGGGDPREAWDGDEVSPC